jgi:L-2-hydroxyglutarate oxidase LhgO
MGGEIYFGQKVQGIVSNGNSAVVQTLNTEFEAGRIVNCAGLYSIGCEMTDKELMYKFCLSEGNILILKKKKNI